MDVNRSQSIQDIATNANQKTGFLLGASAAAVQH
jgi:hypothetical protein